MRYRKLPIEKELEQLSADEAVKIREGLAVELMSARGFQLVTGLLRDVEALAMLHLRLGNKPERMLGCIECVAEIRRRLVSMLPGDQRANVQWHDEEFEEFGLSVADE